MRAVPLTALNGGINRLRVKGAARATTLYDLTNAYVTQAGSIVPREGTIRAYTLDSSTIGLMCIDGVFNVFASALSSTIPSSFTCNVLLNPANTSDTPKMLWFAKPFMGFPYVVASFASGAVIHYWLQSDGEWTASSVYFTDNIITPTTPNGLAYQAVRDMPANPTWTALTSTSAATIVEPTEYTGFAYVAITVEGTTPHTSTVEPTWPTVAGGIVQEFGDFDLNSNDIGTVSSTLSVVASGPLILGTTITDRYGDSSTIAGQTGTFASALTSVNALPIVTTWNAGTQYVEGSVVRPTTTQGAYINAIPNGDFEDGNDGNWVLSAGDVTIVDNAAVSYQGNYCVEFSLNHDTQYCTQSSYGTVNAGQSVTATAYFNPNNNGGNLGMWLNLIFYNTQKVKIATVQSNGGGVNGGYDGFGYRKATVTGTAPANSAYVQVQIEAATGTGGINPGYADLVQWNLETPVAITNFVYEAVQSGVGVSGAAQPAWPTVLGNEVVDGTVTWEAVGTSIITWQAIPIMMSGAAAAVEGVLVSSSGTGYVAGTYTNVATSDTTTSTATGCTLNITIGTGGVGSSITICTINSPGTGYAVNDLLTIQNSQLGGTGSGAVIKVTSISGAGGEPTFPTTLNSVVFDSSYYTDAEGTKHSTGMSWQCIARNITDPNCPNSIPVALGASHVFAGDEDICDFSAAVNPTDWTSQDNAGYLPTGTNNYGSNPIAALALYRSNLMVFNSGGYQMWQIDPDPDNMALLDAEPVGSVWPLAMQSVANDLLVLTEVGVRNIGVVGATANLQVGNTGQPVDVLVRNQIIATSSNGYIPRSLYYPGRGQYWLMFGPQAFVLTMNGQGTKSWSRYTFPYTITDWALNGEVLFMRTSNNLVWQFDYDTLADDYQSSASTSSISFTSTFQWPYLDMGMLGTDKMLYGVDIVGVGSCSIQIAYLQSDPTSFSDSSSFASCSNVTSSYAVALADTVPGTPIPFPINAPSYSLILQWNSNQAGLYAPNSASWEWDAANLYLTDQSGRA
jgi:hypothetical protein